MRILITGADGQLGRDLRDALAGRVPAGGRRCALLGPEGPRPGVEHEVLATDVDTMRVDDRDAILTTFSAFRPELVLHGGALTAVDLCETEVDAAVRRERRRHAQRRRGGRPGGRAHGLRLHRLRLRRHVEPPVPRVGPTEPGLGVRRLQAGGGAGVPPRVDHRAHELAVRCPRRQHGGDRAAPGRGRRASSGSSTTSTARRRSPRTWRPPSSPWASTGDRASST